MRAGELSFRVKLVLAYVGSALVGLFLLFAAGSYYINQLQKRNVDAAVRLAEDQARQMAVEALDALQSARDRMSEPAFRQRMRAKTQIMLESNDRVVWAAVIDEDGNKIFEQSGARFSVKPVADGSYDWKLPSLGGGGQGDLTVSVVTSDSGIKDIKEPITRDGKKLGEVHLRVRESAAFQGMETVSRQISAALVAQCGVLLALLTGVFVVLWRLFNRQLALAKRNAQLDRMAYVGTLASGLAHEIRNPLSSMSVNLQVMTEELSDATADAKYRAVELAGRVEKEVRHLNATLSSFLDFALPSKDNFAEVDLKSLVTEMLEVHAAELERAEVEVDTDIAPGADTVVVADRRLIHQALRNVIVNAAQVMGSSVKRKLKISVTPVAHGFVRVSVSDTGPGIPQEQVERIFEAFYTTRRGGSGLGLAVAKKAVDEHGGRIWAENNEETLGATFHVELPRHPVGVA